VGHRHLAERARAGYAVWAGRAGVSSLHGQQIGRCKPQNSQNPTAFVFGVVAQVTTDPTGQILVASVAFGPENVGNDKALSPGRFSGAARMWLIGRFAQTRTRLRILVLVTANRSMDNKSIVALRSAAFLAVGNDSSFHTSLGDGHFKTVWPCASTA
jgi:hypothetical protein